MRENILILDTVDSTNDYLKKEAEKGAPDGTVVIAREQTSGKGRKSHSFVSSSGGIYYSLLIRPEGYSPADILTLTPKAGVCVCHALRSAFGIRAGIKWVNDIFYHNKKICGILAEGGAMGSADIPWVVIGIGVNLNQTVFPTELSGIATSLKLETGKDYSFDIFAEELTRHLDLMREDPFSASYLEEYRKLCITVGRDITFVKDGVPHISHASGIDDAFGLITGEGILRSGEVSVRPV